MLTQKKVIGVCLCLCALSPSKNHEILFWIGSSKERVLFSIALSVESGDSGLESSLTEGAGPGAALAGWD